MSTKKVVIAGAVALVVGLGGYIGFSMRGGEGENASEPRPRVDLAAVRPKEAPTPDTVSPPSDAAADVTTATTEPQTENDESALLDGDVAAAVDADAVEDPGKIKNPEDYASLSGVVIDDKGYPVSSALVELFASGQQDHQAMGPTGYAERRRRAEHFFSATSDETGAFEVTGISYEGFGLASASAPGFTFNGKSSSLVRISPRSNTENVQLVLSSGVTINGTLLTSTKRPVADGTVSILGFTNGRRTADGMIQSTMTDEHGRFRISFPSEGLASLTAASPTYGDATFSEVGISDEANVELVMDEQARVAGRIDWSDGTPAPGVTVALIGRAMTGGGHQAPGHYCYSQTNESGDYVIESVDVGQVYEVAVFDRRERPLSQRLPFGALQPGEERTWDYKVEVPIVVRGVVYGETTRKPLTKVKVSCQKDGRRLDSTVSVGSDGAFELCLLSGEGSYYVYPQYWRLDPLREQGSANGETLTLRPGDDIKLDLYLPDTFTMAFAVVDMGGNPVPGVELSVLEAGHIWGPAGFTDAEGHWVYEGFIAGIETGVEIERDGKTKASSGLYVGEPGEIVPEQVLVLRDFGGMEGDAVDETGHPLANVAIAFEIRYGDDGVAEAEQRTDENGHFVLLDDVPATLVQVLASATINLPDSSSTLDWDSGPFLCPADMVVDLGQATFAGATAPTPPPESSQNKLLARVP